MSGTLRSSFLNSHTSDELDIVPGAPGEIVLYIYEAGSRLEAHRYGKHGDRIRQIENRRRRRVHFLSD